MKQRRRNRLAVLVVIAAVVSFVVAVHYYNNRPMESKVHKLQSSLPREVQPLRIRPTDYVMAPEDAKLYVDNVINPIFLRYANNNQELPALRSRLIKLAQMINSKQLVYEAMPAYYPLGKTFLMKVDYDPQKFQVLLVVFVPAIKDVQQQKNQRDFEDNVAVALAHEMIHLEQGGQPFLAKVAGRNDLEAKKLLAQDEAAAWGKTIIEILRPLAEQGWNPEPKWLDAGEKLKMLGDNYQHPAWVINFYNPDRHH